MGFVGIQQKNFTEHIFTRNFVVLSCNQFNSLRDSPYIKFLKRENSDQKLKILPMSTQKACLYSIVWPSKIHFQAKWMSYLESAPKIKSDNIYVMIYTQPCHQRDWWRYCPYMFIYSLSFCPYVYRVVQKSPVSLWLRITFDNNKIERCDFHRSKEETKTQWITFNRFV